MPLPRNVDHAVVGLRGGDEDLDRFFRKYAGQNQFRLHVGTTYVAGLVAARSDRPRLLPRVFFGLALALIPLWYLVQQEVISAFVLLVLASKQFQSIALLAHWQAMGDLLHGRQAKRLFPAMAAGYTLGTIVGSFASDPIAQWVGIDGLLPVAARRPPARGARCGRRRSETS